VARGLTVAAGDRQSGSVEYWSYADPSRLDEQVDAHLERLAVLRARIRRLMVMGDCGSAGNPHMWVMVTDRNNVPRTVCAKCGASA
jgi:hypothetical protein